MHAIPSCLAVVLPEDEPRSDNQTPDIDFGNFTPLLRYYFSRINALVPSPRHDDTLGFVFSRFENIKWKFQFKLTNGNIIASYHFYDVVTIIIA